MQLSTKNYKGGIQCKNPAETAKCKSLSAPHEQDDNALFYQIMCVLHGDAFTGRPGGQLVTDLSDIIFYMDFSGIFDRSGARKKHLIRQEKAKALFRPEGVSLDFGSGPHRYLAFEHEVRKVICISLSQRR